MRKVALNVAVVLVTSMIMLGAAEVLLRLTGIGRSASFYTGDRTLGWALRPNARGWFLDEGRAYVVINALGMRDVDRTVKKRLPNVFRIAAVGDSLTEARQVDLEKTWTQQLEVLLPKCPQFEAHLVEVLNFGVGGYGTAQERLLIEKRVLDFDPDIVLLAMFVGNDLYDNIRALNLTNPEQMPYFELKDGRLVLDASFRSLPELAPEAIVARDRRAEIFNTSSVLQLVYRTYQDLRLGGERTEPGVMMTFDLQQTLYQQPPRDPLMQQAWEVTEALLLDIRRITKDRLWLTVFPTGAQVHSDVTARTASSYPVDRLARFAQDNAIHYIDVFSALDGATKETKLPHYGFDDELDKGHLNVRGNEVVAAAIAARLCQQPEQLPGVP